MSFTPKRRRLLGAAVVILLGAAVAWLWWAAGVYRVASAGGTGGAATEPALRLADPTALVGLHDPATAPRDDLRIVGAVVRNYLQSAPGPQSPPLGFNEEVVRALCGENPLRVAFIPPGHPAIDQRGELCDRWGTPFFFHPLSAEEMEIRSAGPDRTLFNDDDLVASSAVE